MIQPAEARKVVEIARKRGLIFSTSPSPKHQRPLSDEDIRRKHRIQNRRHRAAYNLRKLAKEQPEEMREHALRLEAHERNIRAALELSAEHAREMRELLAENMALKHEVAHLRMKIATIEEQ